jgi:hypothetical protein
LFGHRPFQHDLAMPGLLDASAAPAIELGQGGKQLDSLCRRHRQIRVARRCCERVKVSDLHGHEIHEFAESGLYLGGRERIGLVGRTGSTVCCHDRLPGRGVWARRTPASFQSTPKTASLIESNDLSACLISADEGAERMIFQPKKVTVVYRRDLSGEQPWKRCIRLGSAWQTVCAARRSDMSRPTEPAVHASPSTWSTRWKSSEQPVH